MVALRCIQKVSEKVRYGREIKEGYQAGDGSAGDVAMRQGERTKQRRPLIGERKRRDKEREK